MSEIKLDLDGIKKYIKIRKPVLMLDGATVIPGQSAVGYKDLNPEEEFWKGHYPEYPMMPGTYQLEAMAQLFSLTFLTKEDEEQIPRLVGFDKVRFYKEVKPEGRLELFAELESEKRGLAKGTVKAMVDGQLVCSAEIKTMLEQKEN